MLIQLYNIYLFLYVKNQDRKPEILQKNNKKMIMKDRDIREYLNRYEKSLLENDVSDSMIKMKNLLLQTRDEGSKVLIAGNGGSAAMASHVSVDLTKQAGIRTVNFNEADLITCANDYGYERVKKALEFYGDEGDVAILISWAENLII